MPYFPLSFHIQKCSSGTPEKYSPWLEAIVSTADEENDRELPLSWLTKIFCMYLVAQVQFATAQRTSQIHKLCFIPVATVFALEKELYNVK